MAAGRSGHGSRMQPRPTERGALGHRLAAAECVGMSAGPQGDVARQSEPARLAASTYRGIRPRGCSTARAMPVSLKDERFESVLRSRLPGGVVEQLVCPRGHPVGGARFPDPPLDGSRRERNRSILFLLAEVCPELSMGRGRQAAGSLRWQLPSGGDRGHRVRWVVDADHVAPGRRRRRVRLHPAAAGLRNGARARDVDVLHRACGTIWRRESS